MVFRWRGWVAAGVLLASFWGCEARELPLQPPANMIGGAKSAPANSPANPAAQPATRQTAAAPATTPAAAPKPQPPRPEEIATWAPPPAAAKPAAEVPSDANSDAAKPNDANADGQQQPAPPAADQPAADQPADAQPAADQQRFTWAEMEKLLADLRAKGKTDAFARQTLFSWYTRLRNPAYTEANDFAQHLENLKLWQEELPDSTTPLVVMADAYVDYAWEARGDGVAITVTEDGWKLFQERIAKAHELLDQAIDRGVQDGHAYARLLTVAKAEGMSKEETRAILTAGNKLDPTYMLMYVTMADYLLTKWHGEPGDVAKFIQDVVKMVPGDDGLEAVARIITACHCSDRTILFWGGVEPETWNGAARVFFERFPESQLVANYAGILAMAGNDHELGLRVLEAFVKHGHAPDTMAWGADTNFPKFEKWCRAPVHPKGEKYRLRGSVAAVRALAWSGNPRYVWIGTYEAFTPVLLVDTHTGKGQKPLRIPGLVIHKLAFEPNQHLLAASAVAQGFKGLVVWDVTEGDEPFPVPLEEPCNAVGVSPVSPLVAAQDGAKVHLVDVENRAVNHTLALADQYLNALVFSPDGTLLATYGQQEVAVWEVETGKKKYSVPGVRTDPAPEYRMGRPYFFDDQQRLVAGYYPKQGIGGLGRFTEGKTEAEILLPRVGGGFHDLSPDGKYYAADDYTQGQRKVLLWDVEKKAIARHLEGHAVPLSHLSFSPDGKWLATGSHDGELKIWEVEPQEEEK